MHYTATVAFMQHPLLLPQAPLLGESK